MADPRQYGQYGQGSGYPSQSSPNPPPPQQSYEERNYRWFVSGDGIRRDVITADIQRYLGPDALVKPGHDHNVRHPSFALLSLLYLLTSQRAEKAIG